MTKRALIKALSKPHASPETIPALKPLSGGCERMAYQCGNWVVKEARYYPPDDYRDSGTTRRRVAADLKPWGVRVISTVVVKNRWVVQPFVRRGTREERLQALRMHCSPSLLDKVDLLKDIAIDWDISTWANTGIDAKRRLVAYDW